MGISVPGRLCLFGEHSDWAGEYRKVDPTLSVGYCIVAGIDLRIVAEAEPLAGRVELTTVLPDGGVRGPERVAAEAEPLATAARAGNFFSYAMGVAAEVMARHAVGGIRIRVTASDLPIARGLSSSAAICVLVARAYNQVYGLGLSLGDEMELAYAGERRAGSACGRMDQVCAFGPGPRLLSFDGDEMVVEAIRVGEPLSLLVVDLRTEKSTRKILSDLNGCFPDAPGPVAEGVRRALGPLNEARVREAADALVAGDGRRLGALMTAAQATFDALVAPASTELVAPRVHEVLAHPAVRAMTWGGKGVGSQGDGAVQVVARGTAERDALASVLAHELGVGCIPITIAASE